MAGELEQTIREIRAPPSLDRFLLAPSEDGLKLSAAAGPIVYINVSSYSCDALVAEKYGFQAIRLPRLHIEEIRVRAKALQTPRMLDASLLEWLWASVARPVLGVLGFTRAPSTGFPWIWWIPTGPLTKLPIQAAGHCGSFNNVLDRVISSYSSSI
ncbi:hypothetical protein F4777DRAFT_507582 [Nemania sp. FL0916]|nr:hypothetical protein F4777DRAFT_507582 [Nemania sp. FL0916]